MSRGWPELPARLSPTDVRAAVESAFGGTGGIRDRFEELVRIQSVSASSTNAGDVRRSAEATAEWLESSGLQGVRLLEVKGNLGPERDCLRVSGRQHRED